jgi:hypothetical protein
VGRLTFGVILGLAIGTIDVLLMLPLSFPDERHSLAPSRRGSRSVSSLL